MKTLGPRNVYTHAILHTAILLVPFAGWTHAASAQSAPTAAAAPPAFSVSVDPAKYLADVKTLAAPNMEGRGAGTKGIDRAANFLAKRYKSLGLQPAGTKGFFQPFSVITGAKISGTNVLTENLGGVRKDLKLNEDYVPFSFSSPGEAGGSGVVFAGYGITAPEYSYDDYAGVDVKDKVVVILRYEPSGFAAKSGGQGMTHYSQLVSKAINARNHGAKALVVVNGKLSPAGEEDLLTRFGSVSGPENVGIVMLQVKNSVADEWFKAAGKSSVADVQTAIDAAGKPASFAFPDSVKVGVTVGITVTRATVNNVLA